MPLASRRPLLGADWLGVTVSSRMSVGSGNFGLLLYGSYDGWLSRNGLQVPARRAVRIGGGNGEDCAGRELIGVPRRGPGARRAVLVVEGAVADLGGPAAGGEYLRETAEFRLIRDLCRLALDRNVDVLRGQSDHAIRVLRQVLRLAGAVTCGEVKVRIMPRRSDRHHMGPAVRARRRQPVRCGPGDTARLGRPLELPFLLNTLERAIPGQRRQPVGGDVLFGNRRDLGGGIFRHGFFLPA